MGPLMQSAVPGYPCRRGKVRDVYDLGDRLALVATDRISAFDWVLPTPIPGKGRLLTALSRFWFGWLGEPNHLIDEPLPPAFAGLEDRTTLVRKTQVVPFECVVRGYLAGSGWKEYRAGGTVCGVILPAGLRESERLPAPIFTPATKAEQGHDENVSFEVMARAVGDATASELRDRSLAVYTRASRRAGERGVILADTKFEWGRLPSGELILIDEVLTPDSSRYWPADQYEVGRPPPSFDKQFVRDWLETTGWDKASPPPSLPDEVVTKTAAKYQEAWDRIVGR
ncbi:MAG: phosphoribosylaminoimidazolesuccinocarboxamide synthase [Gemmataceae bacterium]|nr:phosphoribosylaminoimidazolesuccinocarboxamide synthase [Gemmataceae bacterium]